MRRRCRVLAAALLLFNAACLTPLKVQKERVAGARRVAIVGFTGVLELGEAPPRESLWEVVSGSTTERDELQRRVTRREAQAHAVYEALRQRLIGGQGWEMPPAESLATATALSALAAPAGEPGLQRLASVPLQAQVGVLDAQARAGLARALGTDGLIAVEVRYVVARSDGFRVVGLGTITRHLRASVHLKMYDAQGTLVWEDREARGEITRGALGKPSDVDEESPLVLEAAVSAFDQLMERFTRTN